MAERENDGFLLYLIDMAIFEANAKARADSDSHATPVAMLQEQGAAVIRAARFSGG